MTYEPFFVAHNLCVDYPSSKHSFFGRRAAPIRAVHNAHVTLNRGEILGIVGESGSGKSSLGRALAQLIRPTEGQIRINNTVLTDLGGARALRPYRRLVQMVFQDSWASLDAHQTAGAAVAEAFFLGGGRSHHEAAAKAAALMAEVGLPQGIGLRLPHALSGGQRQRVNIARALASDPEVLVADEPTSALDVSVKGHVLFMLQHLVTSRHMGLIFISHDLPAVRFIAHRVSVMYAGRTIEEGPTEAIFAKARHPYTRTLLAAAPVNHPQLQRARLHRAPAHGAVSAAAHTGCPYRLQCPRRIDVCDTQVPALIITATTDNHAVACHRSHEDDDQTSALLGASPS